MSKTIKISDAAYKLLVSLKQSPRESFTQVILRSIHVRAETCGELLDATENDPPPRVNLAILKRVAEEKGRRSARPKTGSTNDG